MFWITLQRVVKSGWTNFRRNGLVSYAAILVTTITLSVITGLFLFHAVLSGALDGLQGRVDIAVYFSVDAPEERILDLKETLETLPEVAQVEYSSADQEVMAFRDRHADDYLTIQALDELGDNPFGGNLRIMAQDSSQYESIARVLEGDSQVARDNAEIIERINYSQNKAVIDRLNNLITDAQRLGLLVTIVLAAISVIIMYTTIRLTIYMVREEIGIMRLVGASGAYIRGPFMFEGVLYGSFAWLLTLVIFLPVTYMISIHAADLVGINIFSYYVSNLFSIGGSVLLVGVVLGILSSMLAIRKYLNV